MPSKGRDKNRNAVGDAQRRGPKAIIDSADRSGRKRNTSTKFTDAQRAVRKLREALHLSQEGLARAMGKATVTIATWETKRPPGWRSLDELIQFAEKHGQTACAKEFSSALAEEFMAELNSGSGFMGHHSYGNCVIPYATDEEMAAMLAARHQIRAAVSLEQARQDVDAALAIHASASNSGALGVLAILGIPISDCLNYLDDIAQRRRAGKMEEGHG